jgi:hypothetical protein
MKLRSGKIINTTTTTTLEPLIAQFKELFMKFEATDKENFPERIHVCYDIYTLISNKLDVIDSPEFGPSLKFLKSAYIKTFDLGEELYIALDKYISEQQPYETRFLYRMADEMYDLLMKVRKDVETFHPELKNPYYDDGCECNYCNLGY